MTKLQGRVGQDWNQISLAIPDVKLKDTVVAKKARRLHREDRQDDTWQGEEG